MNLEKLLLMTKEITLLFVEDDKRSMKSSLSFFQEFFKKIITAENGEEGLEKFKNNEIDLIITDLNMPKLNGLEMIKRIKEINPDIPVIVLSAYNESIFFMESLKLGVEAYLLKPIDFDKFVNSLKKTVECLYFKKENEKHLEILKEYYSFIKKLNELADQAPEKLADFVKESFNQ